MGIKYVSNTSDFVLPNWGHINKDRYFGEISVKDNVTTMILNSAGKVQVTVFDTNGESRGLTPDHTQDHIVCVKSGLYLCTVSCAINNVAAQNHLVNFGLFKNDGATQFNNVHCHRNLTGGGGDKGSVSLSGLIRLTTDDTVELWLNTDSASDREVLVEDCTVSLVFVAH